MDPGNRPTVTANSGAKLDAVASLDIAMLAQLTKEHLASAKEYYSNILAYTRPEFGNQGRNARQDQAHVTAPQSPIVGARLPPVLVDRRMKKGHTPWESGWVTDIRFPFPVRVPGRGTRVPIGDFEK